MKITFLSFKKNSKKYSHVANYLSNQHAKHLVKILFILGYTKIRNIEIWVCIFQIYKFYQICYFCVAHNIKNFVVKFCILTDYIIDYILIYFHNFLKLETIIFNFFKEGALKPRSQKYFQKITLLLFWDLLHFYFTKRSHLRGRLCIACLRAVIGRAHAFCKWAWPSKRCCPAYFCFFVFLF
jgi:hypothetical protein